MRSFKSKVARVLVCSGIFAGASLSDDSFAAVDLSQIKNWKEIPRTKLLGDGGFYSLIKLPDGTQVNVVAFDLKSNFRLRPVVGAKTQPVRDFMKDAASVAAINGGYFNLSDGESASYVVLAGKVVCDPRKNQALVSNPKLKEFLPVIFSQRSELRVLKDKKGSTRFAISPHETSVPAHTQLVDSLQAGPQLLPSLRASEEAFLRTQSDGQRQDSIGCNKAAARSAVGLTDDNQVLVVAVAGKGQDQESSGLTLSELAGLLKALGATSAINLDGGASTTLCIWPVTGSGSVEVVCGKSPLTKVKSALVLEKVLR